MQKTILVADDERAVRESVSMALRREGFATVEAADGNAAWNSITAKTPDLAILDISMPFLEGTAILARIRAARMGVPVIYLTSRDEEIDRIAGLESGADDYVSKPFSMGELLARVKAVLRRLERVNTPTDANRSVALSVNPDSLSAFWNGTELALTLTEFRMLERLNRRPGEVVSREQLMHTAFPLDEYASERSADSHIKRLRKKLEAAGAEGALIETMYGAGYRIREEKQ